MSAVLAGFIIYLVIILVVGIVTSRFINTQSDFILGGRRLGPWVIAFSERASGESAWLLIGLPGLAFAAGFAELWTAIGCTSGILFSWLVIARRLRSECERFGDLTLPDFFMNRFPEGGLLLRFVASGLIAFFFAFYVAAQINGAGKVLLATFPDLLQGIKTGLHLSFEPRTIGMIVGALIIVFYAVMGGFLAVAWTDLVQGIIMIFTLVVLPVVVFIELAEEGGLGAKLHALNPNLLSVTGGASGAALWVSIVGGLSWGLGYMGQPHLLARFQAIRRVEDIRKSALIAVFWAVPAFWGAFLIGVLGLARYGTDFFDDPEKIMPHLALDMMPAVLAGVMISGAVAAMMSTADSQLLTTSSTLSEDIFHKVFRRNASQDTLVRCSRGITLGIGVLAFVLAVRSQELVYYMVAYAWSGLAASFGPPLLLALWWRRTNGYGVLAGMIGGATTVIVWKTAWFARTYAALFLDPSAVEAAGGDPARLMLSDRFTGFALSLLLVVFVSLATGRGTGKGGRDIVEEEREGN